WVFDQEQGFVTLYDRIYPPGSGIQKFAEEYVLGLSTPQDGHAVTVADIKLPPLMDDTTFWSLVEVFAPPGSVWADIEMVDVSEKLLGMPVKQLRSFIATFLTKVAAVDEPEGVDAGTADFVSDDWEWGIAAVMAGPQVWERAT